MVRHAVIDVHQHMGPWPFPGRWGGIEENLRLMAARGIDVAVVSSAQAVVQDMVAGNADLAASISGHPNLYGYVTLNPTVLDLSRQEIERYRHSPRFIGFKIHTAYSGCSMGDPRLAAMVAVLEGEGRPLLIHTFGADAVAQLRVLAGRHPALPIIMGHAGGDAWRAGIAAARECPNLYLDFAGSTPVHGAISRGLAEVGAGRILFGSDATLFDPLYMKAFFEATPMSAAERALIMGDNAQELFRESLQHHNIEGDSGNDDRL